MAITNEITIPVKCKGCFLMKSMESLFKDLDIGKPRILQCELETYKCPCQQCLVKIMCNIEEYNNCPNTYLINLIFNNNSRWTDLRDIMFDYDVG